MHFDFFPARLLEAVQECRQHPCNSKMLQRCLRASQRLSSVAVWTYEAAAWGQIGKHSHAVSAIEASCACSVDRHDVHQASVRSSESPASSGTLPTHQVHGAGLDAHLQTSHRCLSSAVCCSITSSGTQQQDPVSSLYHRTYHETPAKWQTRSFAKASRLVHPPSRAAKKIEDRLPASRRAVDHPHESSTQPVVEGEENSSGTDEVIQAQESRPSDAQVGCFLYSCSSVLQLLCSPVLLSSQISFGTCCWIRMQGV